MPLRGYNKGHQLLAERKLESELAKPERIALEAQFAKKHQCDTDDELLDYIVAEKMKLGKHRFKRYHFTGYCYILERFGSWSKMMYLVNKRIEEIRSNG